MKRMDIVAVGTQECGGSIAKNVFRSEQVFWEQRLKSALPDDFILLRSVGLMASHLAIFARPHLCKHAEGVKEAVVRLGAGGFLGNKVSYTASKLSSV